MAGWGLFVDVSPIKESRDFRILWLAQLISWCGRQVVIVAMPYQVYVVTRSSLAVGLLGIFQVAPIILAGLYGGVLADRYDRRRVQLAGKAIPALGSIALLLGALSGHASATSVFAVAGLTAIGWSIDQAARGATVPRLVSRALLPSAMSLSQTTFQTAAILGPALAGVLIASGGVRLAYTFDILAFLPAGLL